MPVDLPQPTHPDSRGVSAVVVLCVGLAVALVAPAVSDGAGGGGVVPPAATRPVDFGADVRPILATSCHSCHGEQKQKGGLRLDLPAAAFAGGDSGKVILPGDGAASPLIRAVAGVDPDNVMPAKGPRLTAEQVGLLRAWIDQGARWPGAPSAAPAVASPPAEKSDHWAFKPLARPPVPTVADGGWGRNDIDRFVYAKLREKGLTPSPPADRRTLIRRVTFDLTGLTPTLSEVEGFVDDSSPDAYEKVVDRLLASPRYGERWARHWMDVAHYAETHGNDEDRERPNAWPYRDYLVRSFNGDKPYARFVEEQVAGDVLYPDDPQATVATGFLAAGPWDESSHMGIRDDTIDKKVAQYLDRDDMIVATFGTFASVTVGCARCHDHKFDPIPQAEYYGLQAVFAGIDRADRPYDPDPQVLVKRRMLLAQKRGLETGKYAAGASPTDEAVRAEVAVWERSLAARKSPWAVLDPAALTSANGSTLVKQADGSVVATGTLPAKDTYTITATTDLTGITAVRLELLADDNLPHHGPGRQPDNGNLHLNEFFVKAGPKGGPPAAVKAVEIAAARADFDQQGWTAAMSIDRKPETAWGIFPQTGKPHAAVFEFKQPVSFDGGAALTFVLEQTHGRQHLIGRFRLSATAAPLPIPLTDNLLPPAVAQVVATPESQRSQAQRVELAAYYLKSRVEEQLKALPPPQKVYAAASDFPTDGNFQPARTPRPVFVLKRGDVTKPGDPASPGALSCVPGLESHFAPADPNDEGGRRAALAKWLSDPRNCLTWRSAVNRAWHYHFGRGIVATPNDFGHMGTPPTHPELLDWLAGWFLDHGGSLKRLDRLIVTSSAYRQSSRHNPEYAKIDSGNQYLWRMNRTRLDAEEIRDAVLQVSGLLDTTTGGPSAKQFVEKPGVHVTKVADYDAFDIDSPAARRLSIYRFIFRTVPDPFMDAMDCPDASQLTPVRNASVTALQALAMWNDRFVVRYAEHLAGRVAKERPGDAAGQVRRVYELCLGREPTMKESAALAAYASAHGMANGCRVVLNSNEFIFVN